MLATPGVVTPLTADYHVLDPLSSTPMPMQFVTPRASLAFRMKGSHVVARFVSADAEERQRMPALVQHLAKIRHSALAPIIDCSFVNDAMEVVYALRPNATEVTDRKRIVDILLMVSDVADAVGTIASIDRALSCGPFPPGAFVRDEEGGQLVGMGLWAAAYGIDARLPGPPCHLVVCPEMLRGEPRTINTETYWLAYALYELLCAHEPFPIEDEEAYRVAVRDGTSLSLQLLRMDLPLELETILKRAMSPNVEARPTPFDFGWILREFTGVPKKASTDPTGTKPWWKVW